MEPINKKERRIIFFKFLAYFIVTVALIILAVFVNYQFPFEELRLMKAKNEQLNKELQFKENFSAKMNEVKLLLDSVNTEGKNPAYLNQLASTKLAAMTESVMNAEYIAQKSIYQYVIHNLLTIQEIRQSMRDIKAKEAQLKEYEINLDKCQKSLSEAQTQLAIFQLSKKE